ncbi:MAG TPA: DUF4349 domain-containing protein [Thermoanaerobaculia bacterium]|nr:DUF4349 domain-containing protein [Thermoanaerobaculia bacterium]
MKEAREEASLAAPQATAPARTAAAPQAPAPSQAEQKAAPAAVPAQNRAPAIPRKLIRTFNLSVEVRNTEEVAKKVQALVSRLGGYVSSANGQRQGEVLYYSMTVRVPVERVDEALAAIRALALRVNREQQQVEDVTDQYIDLDARMRTLLATEAELRALLAESRQRGRKVAEIMEVYRELVEIRSQIEQIQTQLNSFDKLAALSTINLELVPTEAAKPVAGDEWRPGDTLRSSARTLVAFLRWLVDFTIYALIVLLPVLLVIAVVLLGLRKVWRRVRRPENPPAPPS